MGSHEQLLKMKMPQNYHNSWAVELMQTLCTDPPYCCFAFWCGPCASFLLRRRALYGDMTRYQCCGGYMPCSGKCGEQKCPEFCLFTEIFCCFANSVASTRFMLQDEFNIQTTKCDNCIIGFMICLQQLACICSLVACIAGDDSLNDLTQCLNCISDSVFCVVCACMQTQHKFELDKRDGIFGSIDGVMGVPPVQQMSRMDTRDVPPGAPYHQQVVHGYPRP